MQLQTLRTRIRPFQQTDVADLYQVLSDTEVMQNIEAVFSYEKTEAFLHDQGLCNPARIYAIENLATGSVIGHVIFHPYDQEYSYELGWVLHKVYWGKGLASEITDAMVHYAGQQNISQLILECDKEQTATKRIAEKFGFKHMGQEENRELYKLIL